MSCERKDTSRQHPVTATTATTAAAVASAGARAEPTLPAAISTRATNQRTPLSCVTDPFSTLFTPNRKARGGMSLSLNSLGDATDALLQMLGLVTALLQPPMAATAAGQKFAPNWRLRG